MISGLILNISVQADTEGPPLWLALGEQVRLSASKTARFTVGDSQVVRVLPPGRLDTRGLWIKAVRTGQTDIVYREDGDETPQRRLIQVYSPSPNRTPSLADRAIQQIDGFQISLTERGFAVSGRASRFEPTLKAWKIAQRFPEQIQWLVEPDPALLAEIKDSLDAWIRRTGMRSRVGIEPAFRGWTVTGTVDDEATRARLESEARLLFPFTQTRIEAIARNQPTLYFRVFLLELKRSEFHRFGLQLNPGAHTSFKVTPSGVDSAMRLYGALALEGQNGLLRVLSEPELVVKTPGEAELFSGGEIPIRTESRFVSNLNWKRYGLSLALKSKAFVHQRVQLEITAEISQLDLTVQSADHVPGLRANRMRTEVDARLGRPILLSGLTHEGTRKQVAGFPFLKDLPVLGGLFGSEEFLREESELVVALIPHLSAPEPKLTAFQRDIPLGPTPPPRHRMTREELRALRESPDYPWNALE